MAPPFQGPAHSLTPPLKSTFRASLAHSTPTFSFQAPPRACGSVPSILVYNSPISLLSPGPGGGGLSRLLKSRPSIGPAFCPLVRPFLFRLRPPPRASASPEVFPSDSLEYCWGAWFYTSKGRDLGKRRYSSLGRLSATPPRRSVVARKQAWTLWFWPGPANELARHCPVVRRWAVTCGARGRGLRGARGGARLVRLKSDGGGLSLPSGSAAVGPGQGGGSVSEQ